MAKVKRLVLGLFALLAACAVALAAPGEGSAASLTTTMTRVTSSSATVTDNLSDNNYSVYYASTVKSYLYENEDGGYTRVEYTSSGVVVEEYSSTFSLESAQTLELELSLWGGFYCGSDYNYLVFGQSNSDEDDSVEVVRVVKYTKDWTRVSACSIYGANTYKPFNAGSCRMTEVNGSLYVYSCHTMYASSDGNHHQANMTFVIDEDSMEVTDSYYSIMNNSYGYVSHSFNQFIQTDGTYVYRVDHGDAYPRGIYLSRMTDGTSVTKVTYATIYSILGTTGANATGVSIGGMELSTDNVLVAGNSVDMSDSDNYSASGTRNIFVTVTDKSVSSTSTVWFTSYDSDDGVTVRTPQLVKLDDDSFLLMWEEKGDSITTKLVLIDGDGNAVGEVYELEVRLSDCQPIVDSNGYVTWYVTDGDYVRFYQIDPDNLASTTVNKDSIADATVTLGTTSYTYTGSARTPSVTVELSDGTTLTKNTDYTVTYSNNTDAGTATVTITGIGFYEGTVTATFTISARSISSASASLETTSYTYDGTAKEPAVSSVTYNSMTLVEGTDYTLSYTDNTDAGTGYAVLTGTGNYTGTKKLSFTISAQELDEDNVTLEYTTTQYTGSSLKPSATVLNAAGETLTSGTDYSISYSDNKSIGTATVTIKGKSNYTGTITKTFTITAQELDAANVTLSATSYTYDGSAKTPTVTVKNASGSTISSSYYEVEYADNVDAGTATVTITGSGNYTGTVTVTFTINPKSLSSATVTLSSSSYTYDGTAKTPTATVTLSGTTLTSGTDYTVSYSDNTSVGTATVTVTGTGNYTGTVTKTFTITAQSLSSSNVSLAYSSATYTGSALKPAVTVKNSAGTTLTEGTDYTVSYSSNTSVGTATVTVTGTGNYTGTVTKTFTITAQSLSSSNVTLAYTSATYTGSALKPSVTVKNSAGTTLTSGTDYTVSYSNNTDVGTATVTITGTGNYTGTVTKTFTITAQSLSSSNVTLAYTSATYTGSALKPSVTVKNSSGTTLTSGTDYTVSYSSNTSVGTATVTVEGIGNYTGTVTETFTITAQSLSSSNVTLAYTSATYTGSALKPAVTVKNSAGTTLTEGTDYTVGYADNTDIGTATVTVEGTGNYTGTVTKTFTIEEQAVSIESATVALSADSYTYDGTAKEPAVTVTLDGTTLTEGTDYTVSYSNNVSTGAATVAITGTGNYTGTVTKTFTITASITRLAGKNRYGTAAAVVDEYGSSDYIIVAAGKNANDTAYADALAASYAAGVLDCSVVLTKPDALPEATAEAILESGASTVIIVGGTAAVSEAVEAELEAMGLEVARIAGSNRYETAALIYGEFASSASGTAILATGQDFADALSASPLSYAAGWPILLTKSDSLPAATLEALADFDSVVIVGGTSAVSQGIQDELEAMGITVTRIAGSNRYLTSLALAEYAVAQGLLSAGTVGVATGTDYPDALAGGALIGARGGVLLLAREGSLSGARNSTALAAFLDEHASEVDQVYLLGGTSVVAASLEEELEALLG